MSISFQGIPNNLRVPFVAVEFDASRAQQGPSLLAYRCLLIGQKRAAGSAAANSITRLTNADQGIALYGRGSMLHRQAIQWFKRNAFTELWCACLDDNGAGVAGTGTLTFTGPATAAGTVSLWAGGNLVQVAVASGDSATVIAAAVAAAINAALDLPVTATSAGGVVTVLHRHKGTIGNDFDLRLNYQDGEKTPAGVACAIVALATGATNPVLTTLIAALGDIWYHVIAHGYTDATSLTALEAELVRRFGPLTQIDGVAITSANGSVSTLGTLGDTRNSPHSCIVAQAGENPLVPPSEFAAGVGATVAYYATIDPARPLQTLPLDFVPPAEADLFTMGERNLLLYDGVGTSKVAAGGRVQIERIVTTSQTNAAGATDTAYLDLTTMLTLMYLRYSFRNQILSRYPRHKLASDGARFGAGQAVITPQIGKGEALNWFRAMEELGLVEGFSQFKQDLVVARSVTDPNRLEFLLGPDLMNQFVVGAAAIQFRL